jgi:2-hydroxychromene-2-carboxylate isomerase
VLGGFCDWTRGGENYAPAAAGRDLFYRGDCWTTGRDRVCGICEREICLAWNGPVHGPRTGAETHPCCPEYQRLEVERFIRKHGIDDFGYSPYFPVNTLVLMRGAIAARTLGVFDRYVEAMFHHMWVAHKKLDDPAIFMAALTESGLDAKVLEACGAPAVKAELIANTERAVARGAFGSPTFFVDDEMWFGKEHLRDVEEQINKRLSGQ